MWNARGKSSVSGPNRTGVVFAGLVVAAIGIIAQPCRGQNPYPVPGIWDTNYQMIWGPAYERLVLDHQGKFTKTFRCNGKMTFFSGRYYVGPGYIRLVHDHRRAGQTIFTETIWFRFIDRNHMRCHDRITGGKWTARRVNP